MSARSSKKQERPTGYPGQEKIHHGLSAFLSARAEVVFRTCCAKLHNVSQKRSAALLQVFKNNTLAAAWILRDIEDHDPQRLFAQYRKPDSTSYNTDEIADAIDHRYRRKIRGRYTLNSSLFEGLCKTLAANISSWLQQMADAQKKGHLQRYDESALYKVEVGKHVGKKIGELGRKVVFGYAFLGATPAQIQEAIHYLDVLINDDRDDLELYAKAEEYCMGFGPRRGDRLKTMRRETLRRLRALSDREVQRVDSFLKLREVAQTYLRFTPPGFPSIKSEGLSSHRLQELKREYIAVLEAYGLLTDVEGEAGSQFFLTENEKKLFAQLQKAAHAATNTPKYVPLRWNRADGCMRGSGLGLVYDEATRQYLLLTYILDKGSRHRTKIATQHPLYDVNNPTIQFAGTKRLSTAMLWTLEFGQGERAILDQARLDVLRWKAWQDEQATKRAQKKLEKAEPKMLSGILDTTQNHQSQELASRKETVSGCIRSATLHAHYVKEHDKWWFEAQIAVATLVDYVETPQHVVGVHVDSVAGIFVSVLKLNGECQAQFLLDEAKIAVLLENLPFQASIPPEKRTTNEYHHRVADALRAICLQYQALLGVENIVYRRQLGVAQIRSQKTHASSRSWFKLLEYKLPLVYLLRPIDINGVAPQRDCGRCGVRYQERQIVAGVFTCPQCAHSEERHLNTSREVARRTMWVITMKRVPISKTEHL